MTQSSLRFSNNWARHLQPSPSLCLFLCLHSSAWITDPASQLPSSWPAPDSAVGGQICLALSMICEFPVHGPTCQIKPTPAPSCRAAGIWEVLHPDLVPGLTDTHLLAASHLVVLNAAAPSLNLASCLSCWRREKKKLPCYEGWHSKG